MPLLSFGFDTGIAWDCSGFIVYNPWIVKQVNPRARTHVYTPPHTSTDLFLPSSQHTPRTLGSEFHLSIAAWWWAIKQRSSVIGMADGYRKWAWIQWAALTNHPGLPIELALPSPQRPTSASSPAASRSNIVCAVLSLNYWPWDRWLGKNPLKDDLGDVPRSLVGKGPCLDIGRADAADSRIANHLLALDALTHFHRMWQENYSLAIWFIGNRFPW